MKIYSVLDGVVVASPNISSEDGESDIIAVSTDVGLENEGVAIDVLTPPPTVEGQGMQLLVGGEICVDILFSMVNSNSKLLQKT